MKQFNQRIRRYELKWYEGTLDFPCDFCKTNSYKNFHISVGEEMITVCEKCLADAKLEFVNSLSTEGEKKNE